MRNLVVGLVVLVAILGGFYGGYKVGQNNVSASAASTSQRQSNGGFNAGRGAVAVACPTPGATPAASSQTLARGTVTNLSSTSMTVSATGCDVKVTFSATTAVQKQVSGSTSDLTDNQTVTVTGTKQADGSILAQSIQIGPAGGTIRGPGANPNASGG